VLKAGFVIGHISASCLGFNTELMNSSNNNIRCQRCRIFHTQYVQGYI